MPKSVKKAKQAFWERGYLAHGYWFGKERLGQVSSARRRNGTGSTAGRRAIARAKPRLWRKRSAASSKRCSSAQSTASVSGCLKSASRLGSGHHAAFCRSGSKAANQRMSRSCWREAGFDDWSARRLKLDLSPV